MSSTSFEGNDIILQCRSLQQEEYKVLESIYPECVPSGFADGSLKLEIPVEFSGPRAISLFDDGTVATASLAPRTRLLHLSTLPPLLLNLILPPNYPLRDPPEMASIRATHMWLPHMSRLQMILTEMWQPGEGVLYNWVEFIRTGQFLEALRLTSDLNDQTVRIEHPAPWTLEPLLRAYETSTNSTHFAQNSYTCAICLTSHKGSKCLQLSCDHVFCRSCLEDFWGLCISEGDVGRVGCPDPGCVKSCREANEEEVARVVSESDLQRWRWLKEKRRIEKDPTIIHCPMAFCQTPIPKPPGVEEGTGWERLRSCSECTFSFCAFCRRTWHGPITPCPITYSEKLVLEYLAAPENSPERQLIERRFGKVNVLKLVSTYQEEQMNREWLESSTMACPGCQVHVEKSLGCNHMTCAKCRQHFCYRCGDRLAAEDPYKHFSTPGHRCYYKLFDFQAVDEEWQPMEGFLGA